MGTHIPAQCRHRHVDPERLTMAQAALRITTTLFLILSTSKEHHHDRKLRDKLEQMGAVHVHVVYGCLWPTACRDGVRVKYNQIVAYSIRHRWFPELAVLMQQHSYSAVVYLEANANIVATWKEMLSTISAAGPQKDIFWLGYTKTHPMPRRKTKRVCLRRRIPRPYDKLFHRNRNWL